MKEVDILIDILEYKISNELFYNDNLIHIKNPEARQLFTQMRDDEMREIEKLQQKIQRLQGKQNIIAKMFPARPRF